MVGGLGRRAECWFRETTNIDISHLVISPIIISGSTLKKREIHNLFSVCVMDGGGGGEGGIRVRASRCNNNISYISISSDLCLEYC